MTSQPASLKSFALSEYWQISVGHTKVKSSGQKNSTTYFPILRLGVLRVTLEVGELDFLKAVPPGHGLELGSGVSDSSNLI